MTYTLRVGTDQRLTIINKISSFCQYIDFIGNWPFLNYPTEDLLPLAFPPEDGESSSRRNFDGLLTWDERHVQNFLHVKGFWYITSLANWH
jgi:hypothetical protein